MARELKVKTVFYSNGREIGRRLSSANANKAVGQALFHLEENAGDRSGADAAEVFDDRDGKLYAALRFNTKGAEVVYKRNPRSYAAERYSATKLLDEVTAMEKARKK